MRQRTFLTADWNNILMLNYAVDASLLERFVPAGTELDQFEGRTHLSLIGFEFNRARLFGLAVPFHQSFEEVNLRFYAKRSSLTHEPDSAFLVDGSPVMVFKGVRIG